MTGDAVVEIATAFSRHGSRCSAEDEVKCDGCDWDRCKIVGYYYLYRIDRGANKIGEEWSLWFWNELKWITNEVKRSNSTHTQSERERESQGLCLPHINSISGKQQHTILIYHRFKKTSTEN